MVCNFSIAGFEEIDEIHTRGESSRISSNRNSLTFIFTVSRLYGSRLEFINGCCGHTLEHTAGGCSVIPFTSGLPPASENIPLPQIIFWCCMTGRLRFRGLIAILATLKISWLIDWLIDWLNSCWPRQCWVHLRESSSQRLVRQQAL